MRPCNQPGGGDGDGTGEGDEISLTDGRVSSASLLLGAVNRELMR